jgi:hypothetical protein
MDAEHVKRLPVVDDAGRIMGVVSRKDLLSLYLRDDEDIRREVVNEVLVRVMWIDPSRVSVSVAQGIVTLDGTVERRSSLSIINELVARLAGVVEVVGNSTTASTSPLPVRQRRTSPIFVGPGPTGSAYPQWRSNTRLCTTSPTATARWLTCSAGRAPTRLR